MGGWLRDRFHYRAQRRPQRPGVGETLDRIFRAGRDDDGAEFFARGVFRSCARIRGNRRAFLRLTQRDHFAQHFPEREQIPRRRAGPSGGR